tara:strand:- start:3065 stop:5785 length:2721 start_codon:yes stop_codon:yes gene_type:complete
MSLVFLKSENRESGSTANPHKPSRFSNYFTQPLHLEPNSQVAMVNTKFNLAGGTQLDNTGSLEVRIGQPELNQSIQIPLRDPYVTEWENETNTIARAINMLGLDDAFNHVYVDETTPSVGGVPASSFQQQDVFNAGTNFFYADGEKKCYGRLVQRPINLMFNQGFNAAGVVTGPTIFYNQPNGYGPMLSGVNVGNGDNRIDFTDLTQYDTTNVATLGATTYGADATLRQPRHGGSSTGTSNASNFYNTNYAATKLARSAIDYQRAMGDGPEPANLGSPDNSIIGFNNYLLATQDPAINPADYDRFWGYSMETSRCGIKQYVGNQALNAVPELNGGGHDLPSAKDCGGYNIYIQDSVSSGDARRYCNVADVGATFEGRVGLTAHAFGLHSEKFVHTCAGQFGNATNELSAARKTFIQLCDMNASDDPLLPQHALARYIIGVRYKWTGNSPNRKLIAQAEIIDPEAEPTYSEYEAIGPELDITELAEGRNTAVNGAPFNFGGQYDINVHGGANTEAFLCWRFRWTSPYQISIEFCLAVDGVAGSYHLEKDEPYLPPSASDPTAGWCKLYDMNVNDNGTTGKTYYINNWHNGLIFVSYPTLRDQFNFNKGFYDTRLPNRLHQPGVVDAINSVVKTADLKDYTNMYYWSKNNIPYYSEPQMVSFKDDVAGTTVQRMENFQQEEFDATGLVEKEISWLVGPIKDLADANRWRAWDNFDDDEDMYNVGFPNNFTFGVEFGIISNTSAGVFEWSNDIAGIGTPFELYGFDANATVAANLASLSLHFQLSNLPVLSQNGVKATTNKTFYVVDTLCVGTGGHEEEAREGWYCHEPREKLWIDLNNIGPLDLNRLDILISDDDNIEMQNLRYDTTIVLCFRQKPNNTGASPFQGGTQINQRYDPSHTFYTNTQAPQ